MVKDADSGTGKAFRWKRWLLICVVVLLGVVLLLPWIVSATMAGRISSRLSDETGLDVSVASLSAGWFSPVSAGDIVVKVSGGDEVLRVKSVRTGKSLWGLMTRDKVVGDVFIDELKTQVPLSGAIAQELKTALQQIDPTEGLIGVVANPNVDAHVEFHFTNASVSLQTDPESDWQTVAEELNVDLTLDREGDHVELDGQVADSSLVLSPLLCDHGLQFIAPVLAGALDLHGQCTLNVQEFHLEPPNWNVATIDGALVLNAVNAEVNGPMIKGVANSISQLSDGGGNVPLIIQIADQSSVSFSLADGAVYHDGLSFGLPKVLPSLVLTSSGKVGLDQTLNFQVQTSIPFETMGEDPLLQKLGSPKLTVPVNGTFAEPKIEIGEGKMLGGLVRDAVKGLTNDNVDAGPLLEKIAESELLSGLKQRLDRNKDSDGELSPDGEPADDDGILARILRMREEKKRQQESDATGEPGADLNGDDKGLLERIRQRREERRRNGTQG